MTDSRIARLSIRMEMDSGAAMDLEYLAPEALDELVVQLGINPRTMIDFLEGPNGPIGVLGAETGVALKIQVDSAQSADLKLTTP
jgi:hypothetical protein